MKAKEFIPASKPRNFVAKNQKTAGAGAHKDKKRADKQGDVKHKQKQFEESVLAELTGYGSNKHYKPLGTFKRYQIYVSKQKFNNLYFIAVAENPRTLDVKFKAKGNNPQEAIDALKVEVQKEIDVATKVSGQAILDFNVDFVREILEMSTDTFYAKIISGPKLVIAGSEMIEYPDIMRDEGFKSSTIRTYRGGEGTTKLPGVPLNSKAAMSANLIANGRYVLGTEHTDKDGNRVFDLEFDSIVQASNDKMRLRAPAVTVGTNRPKDVTEGISYGTMGAKATQQLLAAFKDASHGVEHFSNDQAAVKGIYDALKDTATEQKVLPQLKSLLDSANHYARQEFDTNPGDFKNWWQFVGQLLEGLVKNYKEKGELEDEPDFELDKNESAPKGWEGTVKAMKKHKDIDNPWALAHYMKNKGYKSHKKEQVEEKKKYPFAGAKVGHKEGPAGQLRTGPARAGKLVGGGV